MNPVQETVIILPEEAQIPAEDQIHLRSARYPVSYSGCRIYCSEDRLSHRSYRLRKKYFRCPFFKNSTICAGDGSFFWCADGCAVFLFEKSRHSFHRPEGDRDRYQCRLDIFRTLSGDCKRTCTDACKKSNRHTYRRVGFWM